MQHKIRFTYSPPVKSVTDEIFGAICMGRYSCSDVLNICPSARGRVLGATIVDMNVAAHIATDHGTLNNVLNIVKLNNRS